MFSPIHWQTGSKNPNEIPERPYSGAASAERSRIVHQNSNPNPNSDQYSPSYRDIYSPPIAGANFSYQGGHIPLNNEVRHAREGFLTDVKSQLRVATEQLDLARKEAYENNQKAIELEKSIASFWNPELKKERLARKEENMKYMQLKEQLAKVLEQNNQLQVIKTILLKKKLFLNPQF